jgi:uncharacterized phage-associated protein
VPHLIANPAVSTAVDVALWFLERARAADAHLPAQKLQNLLYLACITYERECGGPLMPAAFVRNELSVVEPNVYRLFEDGRPRMRGESVPLAVQSFLETVWSRYAHYRASQLNDVVMREIDSRDEDRATSNSLRGSDTLGRDAGDLRPTHRGRRVVVMPWRPPVAPKQSL